MVGSEGCLTVFTNTA